MIRLPSLLILALLLGPAATASADAIGPDMLECPAGFPHKRCHGTEYCSFSTCTTACPAGSTCAEQRWCIRELQCGGRWPDAEVTLLKSYEGSCTNGAPCPRGTCTTIRACAPSLSDQGGAPPPLANRGCSCRIGEAGSGSELVGLLTLVALAIPWRRSHRRTWRRG